MYVIIVEDKLYLSALWYSTHIYLKWLFRKLQYK